MLATLTKTPVGRAAAQRFPRKQQNLREAAPQLHPPKTGRQQTLLSLLSFHWFILSASVISDFGSASSRALPSSPCPSLLQHWAGLQRTSCLILSFFLFVEGYKCKECFCFFFFHFLRHRRGLSPRHSRCTPSCYRHNSMNSVQRRCSVSHLAKRNIPALFPAFELLSLP